MGIACYEEQDNEEKAVLDILTGYNTMYEWLERGWKKHFTLMKSSENSLVSLGKAGLSQ